MKGRVLIIAGSDSGGGAGIQADIKTVTMLDGFAMTAVTALTAQNTEGVFGVLPIPPDFIRQQMEVVLDDIGVDALKTGMLHDAAVIEIVATVIAERVATVPLVVDPVMVAKGGASLIETGAIEALKRFLVSRAAVLTPNLPEAEILAGHAIGDLAAMQKTAAELLGLGCRAVLLKGGHLPGDTVYDVAPFDLVHIPPLTWHQFRADPDQPLGFLCMVNAERDRPQLPDERELARLKQVAEVADFIVV